MTIVIATHDGSLLRLYVREDSGALRQTGQLELKLSDPGQLATLAADLAVLSNGHAPVPAQPARRRGRPPKNPDAPPAPAPRARKRKYTKRAAFSMTGVRERQDQLVKLLEEYPDNTITELVDVATPMYLGVARVDGSMRTDLQRLLSLGRVTRQEDAEGKLRWRAVT